MMKSVKGLSLFAGLALVLTLFFVFGCSNETPVQSSGPDALNSGRLIMDMPNPEEGEALETYDYAYIDKSEGGEIEIERDEFVHAFVVEPNSIEESTTITVRTVDDEVLGKKMIVFEFGPDGLEFSSSAKLRFNMAELNPLSNTANLYYYDPVKRKWGLDSSASIQEGYAVFDIDHFSKYAISD